jgi:hypothetical protein
MGGAGLSGAGTGSLRSAVRENRFQSGIGRRWNPERAGSVGRTLLIWTGHNGEIEGKIFFAAKDKPPVANSGETKFF